MVQLFLQYQKAPLIELNQHLQSCSYQQIQSVWSYKAAKLLFHIRSQPWIVNAAAVSISNLYNIKFLASSFLCMFQSSLFSRQIGGTVGIAFLIVFFHGVILKLSAFDVFPIDYKEPILLPPKFELIFP